MIRIELVSRRLPKLFNRAGIMIACGAVVCTVVFAGNRVLASEPVPSPQRPVQGSQPSAAAPAPEQVAQPSTPRRTRDGGPPVATQRQSPEQTAASLGEAEAPESRRALSDAGTDGKSSRRRALSSREQPRRRRLTVDGGSSGRRRPRGGAVAPPSPGSDDPVWSLACLEALRLYERMPASVRFESLTSSVTGEFTMEGLSGASGGIATQVQDTLRAYSQLDSMPATAAVAGSRGASVTFRGRLAELEYSQLTPLSPAQADELLAQLPAWAGRSGLRDVVVKEPIAKAVDESYTRRRQKIWGRGSQGQINGFIDSFGQVGRQAAVGEIVLIPASGKKRQSALLYAAVDVLVLE